MQKAIFRTLTEDNKLQFDAEASAFALIGSGSVVCTDMFEPYTGFYTGAAYQHSYQGIPLGLPLGISAPGCELVGLRCTTAYCFPEMTTDGFYIYTQPCQYTDIDWPASEHTNLSSHTVEWWAYKSMRSITPPRSGVGLQLRREDNTLVYDNSIEPLRVQNSFTWDAATHGGTTQTLNAPGRIALFAGGTGFRFRTPLSGPSTLRTGWNPGIKMIGNDISIKEVAVSGYGLPPPGFASPRVIMSGVVD